MPTQLPELRQRPSDIADAFRSEINQAVQEAVTTYLGRVMPELTRILQSLQVPSVNVAAPEVSVAAPEVSVTPEVRVSVPEMQVNIAESGEFSEIKSLLAQILAELRKPEISDVNRNQDGYITRVVKTR